MLREPVVVSPFPGAHVAIPWNRADVPEDRQEALSDQLSEGFIDREAG